MVQADIKKIIQSYFDAFNQSDIDALLALLHEDVAHDLNEGERQIGKRAFRKFYAEAMRNFDETRTDIAIMVAESGGRAAAEFTRRGNYMNTGDGLLPANGQAYSLPAGIFFEIDDGLITRVTGYYNKADFIKQLSVS